MIFIVKPIRDVVGRRKDGTSRKWRAIEVSNIELLYRDRSCLFLHHNTDEWHRMRIDILSDKGASHARTLIQHSDVLVSLETIKYNHEEKEKHYVFQPRCTQLHCLFVWDMQGNDTRRPAVHNMKWVDVWMETSKGRACCVDQLKSKGCAVCHG